MPTSTWSKELMTKCWDFLISFVGEGRAGWGVWCVREMEALRYGEGSDKENDTPKEQEGVKVYCWGEVVGEVWVVLFLASERRIKGVGARWMDAGGEAVVVMK